MVPAFLLCFRPMAAASLRAEEAAELREAQSGLRHSLRAVLHYLVSSTADSAQFPCAAPVRHRPALKTLLQSLRHGS